MGVRDLDSASWGCFIAFFVRKSFNLVELFDGDLMDFLIIEI
jgi:hypothetical protein